MLPAYNVIDLMGQQGLVSRIKAVFTTILRPRDYLFPDGLRYFTGQALRSVSLVL